MSDRAYVRVVVAEADADAIAKTLGTPDEESGDQQGHTMFYYDAPTDIASILSDAIERGVPFEGEHGGTCEHPEHGFCAANGNFREWPLLYDQLSVNLREDRRGRLVVDRANLKQARAYWALRRQALECIQHRRPKPART